MNKRIMAGMAAIGIGLAGFGIGTSVNDEAKLGKENEAIYSLLNEQRDTCYAQADRVYELLEKAPDDTPMELIWMQVKVMAGTWLENCRGLAPEDVEAMSGIYTTSNNALTALMNEYNKAK